MVLAMIRRRGHTPRAGASKICFWAGLLIVHDISILSKSWHMPTRVPSLSNNEIKEANTSVKSLQDKSTVEHQAGQYATRITQLKKGNRSGSTLSEGRHKSNNTRVLLFSAFNYINRRAIASSPIRSHRLEALTYTNYYYIGRGDWDPKQKVAC